MREAQFQLGKVGQCPFGPDQKVRHVHIVAGQRIDIVPANATLHLWKPGIDFVGLPSAQLSHIADKVSIRAGLRF